VGATARGAVHRALFSGQQSQPMKDPQHQDQDQAPPQPADPPLSARELRAVSDAIAADFSRESPQFELLLVAVDPFHLHVYWHHSATLIEEACRAITQRGERAHLVVRFRELAAQERPGGMGPLPLEVFDLELDSPRGDAQVRMSGSGRRFEAELGLTAADGGWQPLARSNPVSLPPAAPVTETGYETWDVSEAAPPVEQMTEQGAGEFTPATVTPELDPSLRGGAADELDPVFPNTHPPAAPPLADAGDTARQVAAQLPEYPPDEESEEIEYALPGSAAAAPGHQGDSSSSGLIRELHAELHLWGEAAPGRSVSWGGHELPVTTHGEFSLTLPLDTSNPMLPLLVGEPRRKPNPS
jgi:hypothetical protein